MPGAQLLTGPGTGVAPTPTPVAQAKAPSARDSPLLYGLALVANGPAKFGMTLLDPTSGAAVVGFVGGDGQGHSGGALHELHLRWGSHRNLPRAIS